jgi:type VI secretion system secreted protein Hcp
MKKSIFISAVLMIISCFSNQLFAQETITKQKTKSNNTNERTSTTNQVDCVVRISPTDNGISIVFDNAIVSPRDAASGLPTGKRMHKPVSFVVSTSDNTITEVTSSSDMVSGQSTGKSSSEPTATVSKGMYTWIKDSFDKGYKATVKSVPFENGEFPLPADCDDGEYEMSVSFTYQKIEWKYNEKVTSKSYVSGRFIIEIDGGVCRSIKEKGVSVKSTR